MKKTYQRVLLVLLAVSLVFPLFGCQPKAQEESGISILIEQDPAYSAETLVWAEQTIFAFVLYTYRTMVMDTITPKTETRLRSYAQRICQITTQKPIPEEKYRKIITVLTQDGKAVVSNLAAANKGGTISYEKMRELYLELTYAFGAEHVASMVYDGFLLFYDARYERIMERLEEYQYPWYQEEADAIAAEREVFANGIQKESFTTLLRCGTAMAELLAATPNGLSSMFSDAEILEMIRRLDPSKIDIGDDGWELLLSYAIDSKSNLYYQSLIQVFEESGDISRVSAVMNDAMQLLASVLQNLLPEDVAAIRQGDREAVLCAAFSRFTEEDWELFASVTSVSFTKHEYSVLATLKYNNAYLTYLSSIEETNLEQLRASVGDVDFYQNLLNYFAGICPAISYEVHHD